MSSHQPASVVSFQDEGQSWEGEVGGNSTQARQNRSMLTTIKDIAWI
jgi:hypothetical protein